MKCHFRMVRQALHYCKVINRTASCRPCGKPRTRDRLYDAVFYGFPYKLRWKSRECAQPSRVAQVDECHTSATCLGLSWDSAKWQGVQGLLSTVGCKAILLKLVRLNAKLLILPAFYNAVILHSFHRLFLDSCCFALQLYHLTAGRWEPETTSIIMHEHRTYSN